MLQALWCLGHRKEHTKWIYFINYNFSDNDKWGNTYPKTTSQLHFLVPCLSQLIRDKHLLIYLLLVRWLKPVGPDVYGLFQGKGCNDDVILSCCLHYCEENFINRLATGIVFFVRKSWKFLRAENNLIWFVLSRSFFLLPICPSQCQSKT